MKLRKEFQDIYKDLTTRFSAGAAIYTAIERCQALADSQPRKHLSDEELMRHFDRAYGMRKRLNLPTQQWLGALRAVIDAAFEKQKERPVEPLDLEKFKTGEWEMLYEGRPTAILGSDTFIHYHERYTMRRKS